jgi:hypothetical protein
MEDWLLFLGAGASVAAPACLPDFALLSEGVLGALGWTWKPSPDLQHPERDDGSSHVEVIGTPTAVDDHQNLLAQRIGQEIHAVVIAAAPLWR